MVHKIIFIDMTSDFNHKSIRNIAIGASEYQFYNLIYQLSLKIENESKEIICFNNSNKDLNIDNIKYTNISNFFSYNLDIDDKIIIQRIFMIEPKFINKIHNNRIYLWIHDLICPQLFLGNNLNLFEHFKNNKYLFKNRILNFYVDKPNINYIVPSNFCKNMLYNYFSNFGYHISNNNIHVIHNILYKDDFNFNFNFNLVGKDNDNSDNIDLNQIVFASAWTKNIIHVITLFDYIFQNDENIKLVLMTPGWDGNKFVDLEIELKNKYKEKIIILGKQNKNDLFKIIRKSLCVISSTYSETFGCIFAESYYLGTPVIADIRSGAVSEIIDNDYICDFMEPSKVLEKIRQLQKERKKINISLDKKFLLEENIDKWNNLMLS